MQTRRARTQIIDAFVMTTGYERKYAVKVLSGKRLYRSGQGRGKTYGREVERVLVRIWRKSGMMCAPYLKAVMARLAADWEALQGALEESVKAALLRMSPATIDRLLKPHRLIGRGRNRTSGTRAYFD